MAEPWPVFERARSEGRAALMPYMMAGFPDLETSRAVARAYVEAGAEIIELGAPFSDPLADGPVIHDAATKALAAGTRFADVLELCAEIAATTPVVPMVYANTAISIGPAEFARRLEAAGAAGVIIPDLPIDESGPLREELKRSGLALVQLIAPNTSAERRRRICADAEGFIYLVSDTRTTGERDELPESLGRLVEEVKEDSPVPVAVGFGIGTPEQAAEVGRVADGVIIGSRLVRAVAEAEGAEAAAAAAGEFIRAARAALAA
jgi:tryptophan synthase alpha chain